MEIGLKEKKIIADVLQSIPEAAHLTAVVFGSHARDDASFGSDIDIGLERKDGMPLQPGLLQDIQEALENSPLEQRVEVVDLARASDSFRNEALSHTIAI